MNASEQIILLKKIGENLLCMEDEFNVVLQNFPELKGSEFIFTNNWANAIKNIDSDVEFFVKGIHIVETLHKNKTQNNFGFGSPSPTHKIFQQIRAKNEHLAIKLTKWISESGGNYYIKVKARCN